MKFLEVRSTYLDNDEQGVLNDVGEVQLEVSSVTFTLFYDRVLTLMDCTIEHIPVAMPIHPALVSFLPTLHRSVQ